MTDNPNRNPLDIDLSDVDTKFQTLCTGSHRCKLISYDIKESKKTPGLWMLELELETQEPATTSDGKQKDPGFKFKTNISLPGQPGVTAENEDMRKRSCASFIDAMTGNKEIPTRPKLNDALLESIKNKDVIVEMKASKDPEYGDTQVKLFKYQPGQDEVVSEASSAVASM